MVQIFGPRYPFLPRIIASSDARDYALMSREAAESRLLPLDMPNAQGGILFGAALYIFGTILGFLMGFGPVQTFRWLREQRRQLSMS